MKVVRGYKTELDLNNEQRTACLKHAGCARFAYNWGLARSQEVYRTTGKRPSAATLHKELVTLKQTDYPWMYEVSKCAVQEALRDLDTAFKHFFSQSPTQEAREIQRQSRLSQVQEEKQGYRFFPLDWTDSRL